MLPVRKEGVEECTKMHGASLDDRKSLATPEISEDPSAVRQVQTSKVLECGSWMYYKQIKQEACTMHCLN